MAGRQNEITEPIHERTLMSQKKHLYKRLAKFTEAHTLVDKIKGDDETNPIEVLGQEMLQMNIKIEKMDEMVTACYNLLKK